MAEIRRHDKRHNRQEADDKFDRARDGAVPGAAREDRPQAESAHEEAREGYEQ